MQKYRGGEHRSTNQADIVNCHGISTKLMKLYSCKSTYDCFAQWHYNPSAQKWSSACSSAQRQSSAYPLREVGNVLYGELWGLGYWVGNPKGYSPHGRSNSIHISNPHGLILHDATGAHHCHSGFDWCFQLHAFWGHLKGSCRWQVSS